MKEISFFFHMNRITKVKKILKDHMHTRLHFLFKKKNQYIILSISVVIFLSLNLLSILNKHNPPWLLQSMHKSTILEDSNPSNFLQSLQMFYKTEHPQNNNITIRISNNNCVKGCDPWYRLKLRSKVTDAATIDTALTH